MLDQAIGAAIVNLPLKWARFDFSCCTTLVTKKDLSDVLIGDPILHMVMYVFYIDVKKIHYYVIFGGIECVLVACKTS